MKFIDKFTSKVESVELKGNIVSFKMKEITKFNTKKIGQNFKQILIKLVKNANSSNNNLDKKQIKNFYFTGLI